MNVMRKLMESVKPLFEDHEEVTNPRGNFSQGNVYKSPEELPIDDVPQSWIDTFNRGLYFYTPKTGDNADFGKLLQYADQYAKDAGKGTQMHYQAYFFDPNSEKNTQGMEADANMKAYNLGEVGYEGKTPHRAVLIVGKPNGPLLHIQQNVNGEWHGTQGTWQLDSLKENGVGDKLYIDSGQDWAVTGMRVVIAKAEKIISDIGYEDS